MYECNVGGSQRIPPPKSCGNSTNGLGNADTWPISVTIHILRHRTKQPQIGLQWTQIQPDERPTGTAIKRAETHTQPKQPNKTIKTSNLNMLAGAHAIFAFLKGRSCHGSMPYTHVSMPMQTSSHRPQIATMLTITKIISNTRESSVNQPHWATNTIQKQTNKKTQCRCLHGWTACLHLW